MWYAVIVIVALLAALLLAPRPKPQSQQPSQFTATTAEEGREIPVLFGTRDIKSANVVWYGDIKTVAIKSKSGKK